MSRMTDTIIDSLALADGVHAVGVSDGLVFLDIDHDGYFCMFVPERDGPDDGELSAPEAFHASLLEQGLITAAPHRMIAASARPTTLLWREAPAVRPPSPIFGDVFAFLYALVRVTWRFRRSSLAQMIAHAQGCDTVAPRSSHAIVVAHFERLCLWLPFRPQCLFRSFFLLHFLRLYGLRADWIFGVSLFPFHAHCWLADGNLLLAERVGKVEGFATIFQVERASA